MYQCKELLPYVLLTKTSLLIQYKNIRHQLGT